MLKQTRSSFILLFIALGIFFSRQKLSAQEQKIGAVVCSLSSDKAQTQSPRFPLIKLNSEESLKIEFDLLNQEEKLLSYRLVHCNYNWKKSNLQPIEYVEGFAQYELDPAEYSNGTLQNYLHYQCSIPNANTKIKYSGNYRLDIIDLEDDENVILSIPFAVYEDKIHILAEVTDKTHLASRGAYQQVNVSLDLNGDNNQRIAKELKPIILQNGRWDNAFCLQTPSSYGVGKLIYQNYNGATFQGGNEYHKLEQLFDKGTGLGVYRQDLFAGIYRLELYPHQNREQDAYVYDKDQNGRSYIRSLETDYPSTEADYHWVDFTFKSHRIEGGVVVIEGEYFNYLPINERVMAYDRASRSYHKRLLVKEGYQEFQFLFLPNEQIKMSSSQTEGSHYQTTNDYQILIYHRGVSNRADKLIGYQELSK